MVRVLGIWLAALVAFLAVVLIGELVGFAIYPPADVPYPIIYLPRGAKLLIVLSWLFASTAAALTARLLDGRPKLVAAAAAIGFVYAGLSIMAERHPWWMIVGGLVGPVLIGATVAMGGRRR